MRRRSFRALAGAVMAVLKPLHRRAKAAAAASSLSMETVAGTGAMLRMG